MLSTPKKRKILKHFYISLVYILIFCSRINAHSQTQDTIIQARTMTMKEIAQINKTLSQINKGMKSFDLNETKELLIKIEHHYSEIPDLFKIYASDPYT